MKFSKKWLKNSKITIKFLKVNWRKFLKKWHAIQIKLREMPKKCYKFVTIFQTKILFKFLEDLKLK